MANAVTVGQQAPNFTLKDQDQKEITLSSFKVQKNVVLALYPLDFSPVCSKEHTCFHEDLKKFEELDAQVLGISVDSAWAHKAFAQHLKVNYPLLADFHPKGSVADKSASICPTRESPVAPPSLLIKAVVVVCKGV
jgi:peroxiredoxin